MEYDYVQLQQKDNVLVITLTRPEALNALNRQTMQELHDFFVEKPVFEDLKGIIITGAGDKAFIAGADIKEFVGLSGAEAEALSAYGHEIFNAIEAYPKPVVAAINGFALGGGLELAMACHIRIASEEARFGQPEVNLGTVPGYGGTQRLIRLVGHGRALHWLLTGDMIKADQALQAGLVTGVYPSDQLMNEAEKLVRKIAAKAPLAIQTIFDCINAYHDRDANGYALEIQRFGQLFESEDFSEGVEAFLQKRTPHFIGK